MERSSTQASATTSELVSVIIPCYNGEEFIQQALQSVLWQTYANWECILVDDGSTDRSAAIFREFAARDSRFRYHFQRNQGLAAARNTGIGLARGDYIQFLDDDDLLLETRLAVCLSEFLEHPEADVVYSDYVCYRPAEGFSRTLPGQIPYEDAARAFLFELNVTFVTLAHAFLFRRKIIAENQFDVSLHSFAEDVECWIRLASRGTRFLYVDRPLIVYRPTVQSLTANESALISAKVKILSDYAERPLAQRYPEEYRQAVVYWRQRLAMGYFMDKRFGQGGALVKELWRVSTWRARVRLMGWWMLMVLFPKDFIIRVRGLIVRFTPFRWGGWRQFRSWRAPESVRRLMQVGA